MVKNLISYNGNAEYSVDLHLNEMRFSREKVMFITVTTLMDGGMDYTTIFNGLPTVKDLQNACRRDEEAAKFIIKALKEEDVYEFAKEYWNFFEKSEWEDNLDDTLEDYLEKVNK